MKKVLRNVFCRQASSKQDSGSTIISLHITSESQRNANSQKNWNAHTHTHADEKVDTRPNTYAFYYTFQRTYVIDKYAWLMHVVSKTTRNETERPEGNDGFQA